MSGLRLLAGPELGGGPEGYGDHVRRLGQPTLAGRALIEALVRSGLTGRGGASFPAGLKWRAPASASQSSAGFSAQRRGKATPRPKRPPPTMQNPPPPP